MNNINTDEIEKIEKIAILKKRLKDAKEKCLNSRIAFLMIKNEYITTHRSYALASARNLTTRKSTNMTSNESYDKATRMYENNFNELEKAHKLYNLEKLLIKNMKN